MNMYEYDLISVLSAVLPMIPKIAKRQIRSWKVDYMTI